MTLSVCLLTRNEEPTVARAVRSVRAIAHEILVADTASTDRTAEVAAAAGAAVAQFAWEDDFAAGRNHVMARATGDWILWLDAKEELTPQSVDLLLLAIAREDAFGFFVRVRQVSPDGKWVLGESADLRLFRRRPDVRFIGRLHPRFDPAVIEAVKSERLAVGPCDVVLLQHAEPGPVKESKLRWTARLLELELRDRPGQLHYLIEQGRTLLLLNDPRGHAAMAAAADVVHAAREALLAPNANVQVLLRHILTTDPAKWPGSLSNAEARELALRWFPSSPALLWLLAEQDFAAGEFIRAAEFLERLINLGKTGAYDRSQAVAPDIVGERAVLNLGACYLKAGRPAEAEACFVQLTHSPAFGQAATRQLDTARRMKR